MYTVALCDDESVQLYRLKDMLDAYQKPETDGAVLGKMREILAAAGMPAEVIQYLDQY